MNVLFWILLGIIAVLAFIIWFLLHSINGAVDAFWRGLGGG